MSNPVSDSSLAIASRSRTSSSPITTRSGSDIGQPYRAIWASWSMAAEQLRERRVGEVSFVHERASTGVPRLLCGGDIPVDRSEDDPRAPGKRRELTRESDSVAVG